MCVAVFPKCHALRKNNEKNRSRFDFIIQQHAKLSISNIIIPKQKAENLRHNSIFVILFQTAAKGGFSCQTQARTSTSAGIGAGRDGISAEENRMAAHDIFPSKVEAALRFSPKYANVCKQASQSPNRRVSGNLI